MNNKLIKRVLALALSGALLTGTAYGAAQYEPVDPKDPYAPPVSGLFHEQQVDSDGMTGQYSVYIPDTFEPCSDGVLILTSDDTTAQAYLETAQGQQWAELADDRGIAVIVAEPQDGTAWNTDGNTEGRDEQAYLKALYNTIRSKSQALDAPFGMDERAFYVVGYGQGGTAAQEFAMAWPSLIAGLAVVGGEDVPAAIAQQTGDAYSYPFAMAESLEGQQELQLPNREISVPVWLIDAQDTGLDASYWIDAADVVQTVAEAPVTQAYQNDAVRVWVSDSAAAEQITPAVLYEDFLSQVQRFVGTPGGRLEWTVEHTNNGKTGFFTTEQMVDGKLRRWMTYVPSSYKQGDEVPLVVAIHGYSSAMTAFTGDSRWQDVAEENGFIVVFAQGYPTEVMGNIPVPFWNNELMGMEVSDPTDDVAYFRTLVAQTQEKYSIDDTRIYATGHSNGSCEVWLLAMEMDDVFAAFAPIGSDIGGYKDTVDTSGEPVPVWNMKAEYDTDGAAELAPGSTDANTIDYWTSVNGVSKTPEITTDASGIFVTRNYYNADGVPLVRFSEVRNSPHAYTPEISQIVWDDFFSRITLNADGTRTYDGQLIERSTGFTDTIGHWGAQAVEYVVEKGLFTGTSATTFEPDGSMTRAMVVTVLARLAGVDTDTGDTWYDAGAQWAKEQGISDGKNLKATVTREQLATMLYRYTGSPATTGTVDDFADAAQISDWAQQALCWAVDEGVMGGKGNNRLDPAGTATRAEVAQMLMNYCENIA